jgi:hypothetical protein
LVFALHKHYYFFINEECYADNACNVYDIVRGRKLILGVMYCNAAVELGLPCPLPNKKPIFATAPMLTGRSGLFPV